MDHPQRIGGSEEAVIYMSKELARIHNRKIWIEVYKNHHLMRSESRTVCRGILFLVFHKNDAPDVFVSWRQSQRWVDMRLRHISGFKTSDQAFRSSSRNRT